LTARISFDKTLATGRFVLSRLKASFSLSLVSLLASLAFTSISLAAPPASTRSSSGIYFSSLIPDDQFQELDRDLKEIGAVPMTNPDPKIKSIMKLDDLSPSSLLGWLKERVHFIIEENFSSDWNIIGDFTFPNPGINPVAVGGNDAIQTSVMLTNFGSNQYLNEKKLSTLISYFLPGIGDVNVTSPRVGIIQIGSGFFNDDVLHARKISDERNARRTLQLALLFHEARHSDGHGEHLAFRHITCPENHSFAGQEACDANLNGPYSIEARFVNSIDRSCTTCSIREHDILRGAFFDLISRVQKEVVDPAKDPISVLKGIQIRESYCEGIIESGRKDDMPEDLANDCAQLESLKATARLIKAGKYPIVTIPSTDWDPTPEGTFDITKDVMWLKDQQELEQ
jgi:hypothetical protein